MTETKEQKSDNKEDAKSTTLKRRQQYLSVSSKPLLRTEFQHQQQQVVAIDFQIHQTDKADIKESDGSEVLDRNGFIQFFNTIHLALGKVGRLAPETIWDNLFGNITLPSGLSRLTLKAADAQNPVANQLTKTAAMQILFNYDRYPQGIDFYHLSPGLKLHSKTLYYSPVFAAEELPEPRVYVRLRDINKKKKPQTKSSIQLDGSVFKDAKTKQEKSNIKAWWDELYTSDTTKYTTDEAQEVVACFKSFLAHMKSLGLRLPAVPPKHTQSLPVTLGYIVSLLEYLPPENRQAQLDLVSELRFESSGPIRALDLKKSHPHHCRFVHPAMGYEQSQYYFNNGGGYRHIPKQKGGHIDDYRNIADVQEMKDVRHVFWRFVGHTEGLSLSFYLDAEKDIQKYQDPEIQRLLYALLAGMSTGAALLHGKNEQEVQEGWEGLCKGINRIRIKLLQKNFLENLAELELLPPAPLLKKIVTLIENATPSVVGAVWNEFTSWTSSKSSGLNKVKQACDTLKSLLTQTREKIVVDGQSALYQGMRFSYENKEVKDRKDPFTDVDNSLFYSYLEQIKDIQQMYLDCRNRVLGAPHVRLLDVLFMLRSFETFRLDKDQIKKFFEDVNTLTELSYLHEYDFNRIDAINSLKEGVFRLLEHINNNTGLSKTSLDNILEQIKTIGSDITKYPNSEVRMLAMIAYLQEQHPNNFPPGYLKQQKDIYECKDLSREIVAKIDKAFTDEEQNQCVKNLLAKHNSFTERKYQEDTVDLLKQLSSLYGYDSASFNEWLYQITEYKKVRQNDDSLLDLNQVFLFITTEQNPLLLETLIYREDRDRIPHLVQKCSFLQETLQPWLKENSTRLSQASTYPAMIEASIPIDPTKLDDSLLKEEKETETDLLLKETETEGDRLVDELGGLLEKEAENHEKINAAVEKLLCNKTFQRSATLWEAWQYFKDSKPSIEPPPPPQSWEEGAVTSTPLSISSSSTESTPTEEKKEEKKKDKEINVDHPKEKIASMLQVAANSMGEAAKNAGGFFKSLLWKSNKKHALVPEETKKNSAPINPPKLDKKNPEPPKSLFGSITSTITNLIPTKPKPEEQLKEQIQGKQYKDIYLQLKHFVEVETKGRTSYGRFFLNYYERMYRLAEKHRCIKKDLFNYISHFAKKYMEAQSLPDEKKQNEKRHLHYVKVLRQQIMCLENAAEKLDGLELRRLLYSYQQKEANPQELIDTLSNIEAVRDKNNKNSLYKLFSKFSGETILKPDAFSRLCKLADDNPDIFAAIQRCYDNPPYVSLNTVLSWVNPSDSKQSSPQTISMQAAENIAAEYVKKDKEPFTRKDENIFHRENAKKQAKLFQGTEVFKDETVIDALNKEIERYKEMSTRGKIAALKELKKTIKSPNVIKERKYPTLTLKVELTIQLTALLGELLYATSGQELNDTQYLTLYSSLSSQGSTTHQVVTGGGKSRITMALCAGLNILGKNVDFATKNWDLAEREFYTQTSEANYQQKMAEIQKDRRLERLQETALGILSLGLTLTCVEVAMNALPLEMPHVMSLDFSMIPNDTALKLAIAGASVGLLLVMMYLVKSFATHTAGLQSAMGSVAAEKVQGSATGVALEAT